MDMTFKLEYSIETEDDARILNIEAYTDYPNSPIQIILDDGSSFRTRTNKKGVAICSTCKIKNYHVTVKIHDETFEDDINIEN